MSLQRRHWRVPLRRVAAGFAVAGYTVFGGLAAFADDTEILTGQVTDFAAPNILFVIDTSGSMEGDVVVNDNYDPTVAYPGPYNEPDRLYYVVTDFAGDYTVPDGDYAQFGTYVHRDAFVCQTAQPLLEAQGFFLDRFAQFDDSPGVFTWGALGTYNDDPALSAVDRYTECNDDDGIHGFAESSPDVYAANVNTTLLQPLPWVADADDPKRFDWRNATTRYVFFENNYLNWVISNEQAGNPVIQSRMEVVQRVTTELITERLAAGLGNSQLEFNVGLMRFSTTGNGGMVVKDIERLNTSTDELIAAIDALAPSNNTPLAETLYEAYQYFNGGPVTYGVNSQPQPSVPAATSGSNYVSPIQAACQKNYVVLLTDGLPSEDDDANQLIADVIGGDCVGNCLDDLAIHMSQSDNAAGLPGQQPVETFAIGFFTDSDLLQATATGQVLFDENGVELPAPLPGYFVANDTDQLTNAFNTIFQEIGSDVETFTSPAVSVNSLNRLQNRNVLYFTMFVPAPQGQAHWDGNLKAYYLGREGNVNSGPDLPDITILDAGFNEAIAPDGTFRETARSIWSLQADGGVVTDGGFAGRLGINRRVVTNLAGANLFAAGNAVDRTNEDISAQMLGHTPEPDETAEQTEARRIELLDFAAGLNADGTARGVIGDPLHTQPLIATYGSATGEELRLFLTTNDGYLHSVDPTPTSDTSNEDLEEWAFIPSELLGQIDEQSRNPPNLPGSSSKMYGLDGPLSAFVDGGDGDFIVEGGETLYLYVAMRRGGRSYYALDLGDDPNDTPTLAFQIDGGDAGFEKLGQTWSAATPAKIRYNGATREVLIFGGGYDVSQDTDNNPDGTGNAIYIVDARTGALVWSASNNGATLNLEGMEYAIPSDISVLDVDQDGLTDRLYVGDMGAQVWRFDIVNDEITGAKFADLGETGSAGERRFYNRPSVARIVTDHDDFLTIAIGSGWRAHPLATENQDRLYVLKDENVFLPPIDAQSGNVQYPAALTNDVLAPIDLQSQADVDQLQAGGGWYLDLPQTGEKNLSSALIADNRVFFTTYTPGTQTLSCVPSAAVGGGRLYVLDIVTGLPALDETDANDPGYVDLDRSGIPPTPTLVFTEPPCIENCDADPDSDDPPVTATNDGTCVGAASEASMLVATETFDVGICTAPSRTYWVETDQAAGDL